LANRFERPANPGYYLILPGPPNKQTSPLKGDASRPALRRFCYARVTDPEAAQRVLDVLRGMPEIQDPELPPRRGWL
jgi:hypothetical protein